MKKNKFLVYLAILNSEEISENFEERILSFLDIYIKMGQKEPIVEKNGCLKEFY